MTVETAKRPGWPRLLLFGVGDFAFNLYWQSVMLFLLFYYTDALGLPMGVAATAYMVASVWDGIANFLAGVAIDRLQDRIRYGRLLAIGGWPLGLSFIILYLPPPVSGVAGFAIVFAGHLLFRTAYAVVNVAYLAMSARISANAEDRSFVAGVRMLSGSAAAVVVALGTIPFGQAISRAQDAPHVYFATAILFALLGAAMLTVVGCCYRDGEPGVSRAPMAIGPALRSLARNRAFVTLMAAMLAMIVAITVLNKSVLYLFKYVIGDPSAGELALAAMALVSAVAVPAWMAATRLAGIRSLWLGAVAAGMGLLTLFAAIDVHGAGLMQAYLVAMQTVVVGLNFCFWALLPNTIEYGERTTGAHVEGVVFGAAALLQRVAIGLATAILGWSFTAAGYRANMVQSADTIAGMRLTVALLPLAFLMLSGLAMLLSPLGRREPR